MRYAFVVCDADDGDGEHHIIFEEHPDDGAAKRKALVHSEGMECEVLFAKVLGKYKIKAVTTFEAKWEEA